MPIRPLAAITAAVTMALLSGTAAELSSQEAFGTLRREAGGEPAPGTVVEAIRLSDGRSITRAVASAQGSWRLRLSTERLVLRALRIGYAPQVLDTLQLAVGESRQVDAVLIGAPVVLSALQSAAETRCRVRPDSASLVATVFDQARTALAASVLAPLDGPLTARVRVTEETWRADERELVESTQREFVADSLRPFGSASVDSLLEFGFVTRQQERVVNRGVDVAVAYRLPSVELLVDERFLGDYCLYLVESSREHPDWIGVGFRPARRGRVTQLHGTFWIDLGSSELRRWEFGYTGLDDMHARMEPGGWLEFTRLESGVWFAHRWAVRLPALGERIERSGRATMLVTSRDVPVIRMHGVVLEVTVAGQTVFNASTNGVGDR